MNKNDVKEFVKRTQLSYLSTSPSGEIIICDWSKSRPINIDKDKTKTDVIGFGLGLLPLELK